MTEVELTFAAALYTLTSGLFFHLHVMRKGRLKFLKKRLQKHIQNRDFDRFYELTDQLLRGRKIHFLGLRMFIPLGVNLGLTLLSSSWLPTAVGFGIMFFTAMIGRGARKEGSSGGQASGSPWSFSPGKLERMTLKILVQLKDPESRDRLRKYIHDSDEQIGRITIEELIRINKPWTVPLLEGEFIDTHPKTLLLPAASEKAPEMSYQDLLEKLKSLRPQVRANWLPLVLRLDSGKRDMLIREGLNDKDAEVRAVAENLRWRVEADRLIKDLKKLQGSAELPGEKDQLEELMEAVSEGNREDYLAINALFQAWKTDRNAIQKLIQSRPGHPSPGFAVALALEQVNSEMARSALIHLMAHPEPNLAQLAFDILQRKPDLTHNDLYRSLQIGNEKVKSIIPELSTRFAWEDMETFMDHFLKSHDPNLRLAAVKALDHWNENEDALDRMGDFIGDDSWEVRYQVLKNLDTNGSLQALEILQDGLEHNYHESGIGLNYEVNPDEVSQIENQIKRILKALGGKKNHPKLFCKECLTRAITSRKRGIFFPQCRKCKYSRYLVKGVEEVRGVLGPDAQTGRQRPGYFEVDLWNPDKQKAIYADIDVLEIKGGGNFSYDWAVSSVLEVLQNGSPLDPWKVDILMTENPPLEANTQRILKEVKKT